MPAAPTLPPAQPDEHEAKTILAAAGINAAPEAVVQTERERAEKAKALVENLEASLKNLG